MVPRAVIYQDYSDSELSSATEPDNAGLAPVLRRRWVLVVSIVAVCIAAAAFYLAFAKPVYISAARLQVRPAASKSIDSPSSSSIVNGLNFLSTQCEVIKSAPVLTGALQRIVPRVSSDASDEWIADVKNDLIAEPGKKDDLIRVSVAASSPDDAANLVNAVVASYVDYVGQAKRTESGRMIQLLQAQMQQCQLDSRETASAIQKFREKNPDVPNDNDHETVASLRLASLSDAFTHDHLQTVALQATYDSALKTLAQPDGPARCTELYREKGVTSMLDRNRDELRATMGQLKERQAVMEENYLPDHPYYIALENTIAELEKQIDTEDRREADIYVNQARTDWQQALQREQEDDKELRAQRLTIDKANAAAITYANLQTKLEQAKKQEEALDIRIKDLGVEKETGALDVAVVEPAGVANMPAKPEPEKALAVAAALGLMLGVGAALRRDRNDTRLRSSAAIVASLNLPVIGLMPRIKKDAIAQSPDAQAACQIIRRGIGLMAGDLGAQTILFCSGDARAGGSGLVRQLAASYARNGKNVIYIDASLNNAKAGEAGLGWRQILAGTHTLEATVKRSVDGMDILNSGNRDEAAQAACLDESTLAPLLKQLRSKYQIVLVNGPVVSPLGEACMWASVCDATVLVLRADMANRVTAVRAVQSLRDVGANVIGAVVNRVLRGSTFCVLGGRRMSDQLQSDDAYVRGGASRRRPSQEAA